MASRSRSASKRRNHDPELVAPPSRGSIQEQLNATANLTEQEIALRNASFFRQQYLHGPRLPGGNQASQARYRRAFVNGIPELNNATVERNAAAAIAYVPEGPNARFSLSPAQLQAIHGDDPVRAPNGPPVQPVARGEFASLAYNPMRRLAEENENMRVVHGIPSSAPPAYGSLPVRRNLPAGGPVAAIDHGMGIEEGGYRRRRKHRKHTRRVRRRKSTRKNNKRK